MKTKEELIFQALGAASMCWTGAPSGVFDSTRCKQIGDELIAALENAEALKPSHNTARDEICAECNGSKIAWMKQMRIYKFNLCPYCGRKLSPVA